MQKKNHTVPHSKATDSSLLGGIEQDILHVPVGPLVAKCLLQDAGRLVVLGLLRAVVGLGLKGLLLKP